jgi:hypothetical protein
MKPYNSILLNIPPKPILCYDFTNRLSYPTTGTVVTDIFKNSDGTLTNSPTYSAFTSGSMYFDGVDDFLITNTDLSPFFAGTSPNKSETNSIFTWVYPMDNGVIVSEQGTSPTPNLGWHETVIEMVSGNIKFGMWNGAGITSFSSTTATPLNNWYHLGLVYDGSTLKGYVNGVSAGTVTFNRQAPYNGGFGLYYGLGISDITNMGDGSYARMLLSRFEVYNYALTQSQVTYNYNTTKSRFVIPPTSFSEAFVQGAAPTTAVEIAWNTFRTGLTGTYTQFTWSSTNGSSITVSHPTSVQTLANALRTGTATSVTINSVVWAVGTGCGTPKIGGTAIEFSNIGSCTGSSTYALRPHINNANWGGTNGTTVNAPSQTITLSFS